jgi:TolB-like protein
MDIQASGGAYRLGRFTLEPRRQLLDSGRPVALGGKALDLLSVLAEAKGDLVTKDELMAAVWPGIVVEENAIQVHMSAARKALADEADRLATVRGRGYRLDIDPPPEPAAQSKPIGSVAVLAFANLTGDPANDFISDGIAEELITTLHRSSTLRIPARTSSFAYKGRDVDVRAIGRELNVDAVLEGSVRKSGERIRVTAQLVEAATGFHLWAQNFDREDGDLLALQDDLAAAIGRALDARIGAARFRTDDPVAFRLNMQARALAGRVAPEALLRAIDLQQQAIARDPGYAGAWTGLAGTLMVATAVGALPPERRLDARARAEEAIRLDRGAAGPYAIRAVLDSGAGAWLDAERGYTAALELDDRDPIVRDARAFHLLAPAGLIERACAESDRAIADGPAIANLHVARAGLAVISGDLDAARSALDMARLLGGNEERTSVLFVRADLARASGRWREAASSTAADAVQWLDLADAANLVETVFAAAASGGPARAKASEAVRTFSEQADCDGRLWAVPGAAGQLMLWQMLLGSIDDAYAVADRLVAAWRRTGQLASISLNQFWRPELKAFRDDPRFGPLVTELGLLPLWRRIGVPADQAQLMRGSNTRGAGGTAAA